MEAVNSSKTSVIFLKLSSVSSRKTVLLIVTGIAASYSASVLFIWKSLGFYILQTSYEANFQLMVMRYAGETNNSGALGNFIISGVSLGPDGNLFCS